MRGLPCSIHGRRGGLESTTGDNSVNVVRNGHTASEGSRDPSGEREAVSEKPCLSTARRSDLAKLTTEGFLRLDSQ
jgi:hypothetical protein